MQTEVQVLVVKRPAGIRADAPAILRRVEGSKGIGARSRVAAAKRCAAGHFPARIYPVTEAVIQPVYLVVSESRFENHLGDDVRGRVEGIARRQSAGGRRRRIRRVEGGRAIGDGAVIKTTTGAL